MTYGQEVEQRVRQRLVDPEGRPVTGRLAPLVAAMAAFMAEEWRDGEVSAAVADHLDELQEGVGEADWRTAFDLAYDICDFDAERPQETDVLDRWPAYERR